jgi:hypothetical protein
MIKDAVLNRTRVINYVSRFDISAHIDVFEIEKQNMDGVSRRVKTSCKANKTQSGVF